MSWVTCPACGEGEFDMSLVAGPDYECNAGPEYEIEGQHGCNCTLTAEQEEALFRKAAENYGDDFYDD